MLPHYASYLNALTEARAATGSLYAFTAVVKYDERLGSLRRMARVELQAIYQVVRLEFGLPHIPVFLPIRRKIAVRGQAHTRLGTPAEIRVYPIHGPRHKDRASWSPRDLTFDSVPEVMETIIHECAHILEAHRHGAMGHERAFVAAYHDVESALVAAGVCARVDASLRFAGCPPRSYAASLFRRCG